MAEQWMCSSTGQVRLSSARGSFVDAARNNNSLSQSHYVDIVYMHNEKTQPDINRALLYMTIAFFILSVLSFTF